ncbi:tautomerase family protein [Sulfitobacter sp. D35]|uniref:tautomerase family protein n=1 Tax=Sulfitobacter sp. D35 TaxID=3083252 RepID=UPI00296F7D68|nr:tautomerase family protein [Sulfitobacter sp. D35]MDW4496873.1 tautomerase family protein [Sulfitobacter sp. D35]
MPLIDIQVMQGVFSPDEKSDIIARVTQAFGSVAGQALAEATSIRIHEIDSGSWGYAGHAMTTEDARAMRARG